MRYLALSVLIASFAVGYACTAMRPPEMASPPPLDSIANPPGAVLLDGLGHYQRKITTNAGAQRWFDQGLTLTYGFNHDAAERSFLKAIEADPGCAMCWWGAALVLGPHVNAGMDPSNNAKAWERVQKAMAFAPRAKPWEQGFITALASRYAQEPPADRAPLDRAYADAMGALAKRFPDDLDAATLHAEALMDLQPWDYYTLDGSPKGNIAEVVTVLESVMQRDPDHFGALHLYIHAVEASSKADRGAIAADRLRDLVPGSGHLVHMPAHIYTRVGRYHDAVIANEKAIKSDAAYLAACSPAPALYPLAYVPHNYHFLWWAASMEGDSEAALAAAREVTDRVSGNLDLLLTPGFEPLQDFMVTLLRAQVQFGRWSDIAATPRPDARLAYPVAFWEFAQGMAAVRRGKPAEAKPHLAALAKAAADPAYEKFMIGPVHPVSRTLKVAERVLAGEIALASKRPRTAQAALKQAVAIEDGTNYFEPPLWHQPARQYLGAALLSSGKAQEAEAVYRADLVRNAENGWSLYGLAQSLKAQGKTDEAAAVELRQRKAFEHADVTLKASVY